MAADNELYALRERHEIERLNATIERIRAALDECWGQSSQVDDLIDDINGAIEGNDGH